MAGFRTHVGVAAALGVGYGYLMHKGMGCHWESGVLSATLTAVGGMLPDLDSDTGRPVREIFGLAAAVVPLVALPRLTHMGLSPEGVLASLVLGYLFVRYGLAWLLSQVSVHRGMFHSIPAMLISGLVVYLGYRTDNYHLRLELAGGVMLGFFSHLLLDEIYSVDFNGVRLVVKKSSGSALKFFSDSVPATTVCYTILGALLYLAHQDWQAATAAGKTPDFPYTQVAKLGGRYP
jgi:membrane-bound metal-dependent hydrolase YbcI (DUF457 family)